MVNVCIIPARGGSTRIPRKNIKPFLGVPMLVRAIETAKASRLFKDIYVSTEDDEITSIALVAGAKVIARPTELAKDEVGTQEVMRHAVESLNVHESDGVCCLYPCTPLLSPEELSDACVLERNGYVIAVNDVKGGDIGWFYFGEAGLFKRNWPLWTIYTRVHPVEARFAIDINTPEDWDRAEFAYRLMKLRSAA